MLLKNKLVAHRGDHQHAPENTLLAFRKALNNDALYLECDVQLSQDLTPLVIHDHTLARTAHAKVALFSQGATVLTQYSVHEPEKFANTYKPEPLPTLSQLVTQINSHPAPETRTVFVEIKEESIVHFGVEATFTAIAKVLAPAQFTPVIISYHLAIIQYAKQHNWQIGWISNTLKPKVMATLQALQPDYMFSEAKALLQQSLSIGSWQWQVIPATP